MLPYKVCILTADTLEQCCVETEIIQNALKNQAASLNVIECADQTCMFQPKLHPNLVTNQFLPTNQISPLYNTYQLCKVKDSMCFLHDTWSQPTTSFHTAALSESQSTATCSETSYLPASMYMNSQMLMASVTLIDKVEKLSLPPWHQARLGLMTLVSWPPGKYFADEELRLIVFMEMMKINHTPCILLDRFACRIRINEDCLHCVQFILKLQSEFIWIWKVFAFKRSHCFLWEQ